MTKANQALLVGLASVLAAVGILPAQAQTASEIVMESFGRPPLYGAKPAGGVIRDSAGNLYGTTIKGGQRGVGAVYQLDTAGHQKVLYSFTGGADGGQPYGGVILDSAGDLYGTTQFGGSANAGVVYKLDAAGNYAVLYSFKGYPTDGQNPYAGVVLDSNGNLYGTTNGGGVSNAGVVYKLDSMGQETVLHSFVYYTETDGAYPVAGVILDPAGNLYGTTEAGGTVNGGVVYKVDAAGQETVLYSFADFAHGSSPSAGVVRDSAGNLYGTTTYGGTASVGVVYELDTAGHETVLHNFAAADGGDPNSGVILDGAGNFYGSTYTGGPANAGVAYKLDPAGNYKVLYDFPGGADGAYPTAGGVIRDSAGNLYGTTYEGGTAALGVVYELDPAGNYTVLYSFPGGVNGSHPSAGVIRDPAGSIFGTTVDGGPNGRGTVFKVDATGDQTVLYSFRGHADGEQPWSGVTLDSAGNLYGTTYTGGTANAGVVYKLDPAGHQTVLYRFTGGADGSSPYAGVILDSAGNLYGTTFNGGTDNAGVVYKLDPAGQETVLYSFTNSSDGSHPYAGVILDSAGNLYGATYDGGTGYAGVVYKLDPAGQETVLYSFTNGSDGGHPYGGVILDSAGNLYGTTYLGGTANAGVVYKLDPAGQETVLYSFTGADGSYPYAGVIRDPAGNLYGTASAGGTANWGTVFKLDPAGQQTVLWSFTGSSEAGAGGGLPYGGVILDSTGNLYGTTIDGGKIGAGVLFKLQPQ
jgi:uncharacterized repeat protein (TIGR03803 family)